MPEKTKQWLKLAAIVASTAAVLSFLWRVPYIFTVIGFSAWAFVGHLVTADDDMAGGWSNPDGVLPFPWQELVAKAFVLLVLVVVAVAFPVVRRLGGAQ
ncbi:MAG TPA: hypothetical protein VNQ81_09005 [Povalibacter sp.]|nr:hypothetical protein [Povalibacter sp.]